MACENRETYSKACHVQMNIEKLWKHIYQDKAFSPVL